MQEVWKDIKGYEGLYQISNLGNVKSLKRKSLNFKCEKDKILINCKTSQGYEKVMLSSAVIGDTAIRNIRTKKDFF